MKYKCYIISGDFVALFCFVVCIKQITKKEKINKLHSVRLRLIKYAQVTYKLLFCYDTYYSV